MKDMNRRASEGAELRESIERLRRSAIALVDAIAAELAAFPRRIP